MKKLMSYLDRGLLLIFKFSLKKLIMLTMELEGFAIRRSSTIFEVAKAQLSFHPLQNTVGLRVDENNSS